MDLAKRGLTDLQSYIAFLEKHNQLVRVKSPVDATHTLAGIAKKFEGGKVVLFEQVKGHDYPVLIGLYWNRPLLAKFLNTTSERLPFTLGDEIRAWRQKPMPPVMSKNGPANEVVETDPDLTKLPIPVHAEKDGGPYLTSSAVIAKDPDTGVRNVSIHRMMVVGPKRIRFLLEELGHLMDYFKRAEAKGLPLELTVNNGVGLPMTAASAVPASAAPVDADELGIASQLLGEPLELIEAQTVGVEAVAKAQFVIEGRVLPNVRELEGPFAEVTGYYCTVEPRWVFEVTAITRRREPVFHSILSGLEVYNSFSMIAEAGIFEQVHRQVPQVSALHLSDASVPYNLVVQVDKDVEGCQTDAIMAAFEALPFLKTVTAVDTDVDIFSLADVEWAVATRCRYEKDLTFIHDGVGHRLNPMVENDRWTRVGVDATVPLPRDERFGRASMKDVDLSKFDIEG